MERKIGEIFKFDGEWYQCIVGNGCENCAFNGRKCYTFINNNDPIGDCCADRRTDNKDVIFKKLEKVGEPFFVNIQGNNVLGQRYKLYEPMVTLEEYWYRIDGNFINIEIKQIKEDMEEKKQCGDNRFRAIARAKEHLFQATNIAEDKKELEVLDSFLLRCWQMGWLRGYEDIEEKKLNLNPFDLEAAKAGKPVYTRDGRKARIICFDAKGDPCPIIALVEENGIESAYHYDKNGQNAYNKSKLDLMMLPEKKEGWINIYNADTTFYYVNGRVFDTKDEAVKEAKKEVEKEQREKSEYIDTIRVEWKE